MTEDGKIIKGCKAGKRRAFNLLYSKYAATMLGVCLRYSKDHPEAEDILQEGFIKVFTKINSFRGDGSLEGWIRRIMVNTAITFIKQRKNLGFTEIDNMEVTDNETPDELPETSVVSQEDLISIVQSLPEGYRMVLNLYVFENHSHKEISALLDISENTSKTQLHKARRFIRKALLTKNKTTHRIIGYGS